MTRHLNDVATRVWLLLIAITAGAWLIGTLGPGEGGGGFVAAAAILTLSFYKVRLVIRHFMEVAHAPAWLRYACDIWIVVLLVALLWLYA
jgi:hypothetical protein